MTDFNCFEYSFLPLNHTKLVYDRATQLKKARVTQQQFSINNAAKRCTHRYQQRKYYRFLGSES
ncbi:MAG: hypothetical protein BRC33_07870 [Cyanobacteria bacterium SW_9_44_58]|nr:MAG: hypothetical protein BRC33_07870 [Cyanobacteria bacterium SW_9_44_58]